VYFRQIGGSKANTDEVLGTTEPSLDVPTTAAIATAVWGAGSRTLTGFGTLVADVTTAVWAAGSRTLTAISDSSGITTLLTRIVGTLATGTHQPQTGDSFARLGAPVGASISADVQTRLAAASYTAPPTAAANAIAVWGAVSRTITGGTITTVSDKTGYSLSQAFPANFAALGINASGHVSRVTLVDTTTTNTDMRGTNNALLAANYTAPPSTTNIVDAILDDEIETGFSVARTLRIIAASTAGKVTGGPDGPVFRNLSDTANQITGVATEDGNRTTATYGT
jgi:hypothetical protein